MKKAEDILDTYYTFVSDLEGVTPELNKQDLITVVKLAQQDAIDATVKFCAIRAECMYIGTEGHNDIFIVDRDSIRDCAEELKKNL